MSKTADRLEYTSNLAAEEVAGYLEAIAEGLRKHALSIDAGAQSVALAVAPKVEVRLDIRAEPRKSTMQLTLAWRTAPAGRSQGLTILAPTGSRSPDGHRAPRRAANGADARRKRVTKKTSVQRKTRARKGASSVQND